MIEKTYKCSDCGMVFKLICTETEAKSLAVPCPGCGETKLTETDGEAELVLKSRATEMGCMGCTSENCENCNNN
jgi:DNA-directed RNA polymerase subunit RPC12/RpoP